MEKRNKDEKQTNEGISVNCYTPFFFHLARGANAQGVTLSIQTRKIINRTGTYSLQI